jgi:ABC-type transport system substrate-binding protein
VRRAPFDTVLARRAVNLAIDRAAVARRLGGPGLSIPTCQVLPPHFPGRKDYCPWTRKLHDGRWHGPDITRARALVRASGTAGATVDFISLHEDPVAAAAAGALVSALRSIGYHPRVISNDAEYYRRLADPHGQGNISTGNWSADYPSPSVHARPGPSATWGNRNGRGSADGRELRRMRLRMRLQLKPGALGGAHAGDASQPLPLRMIRDLVKLCAVAAPGLDLHLGLSR